MLSITPLTVYILSLLSFLNIVLIFLGCFTGLVSIGLLIVYINRANSVEFLTKMKGTFAPLNIKILETYKIEPANIPNLKNRYESITKLLNDVDMHIQRLIEKLNVVQYRLKISLILTLVFILAWAIIPSKNTYMKMIVSNHSNSEEMVNTKIIMDHIDATADRVIKAIRSN